MKKLALIFFFITLFLVSALSVSAVQTVIDNFTGTSLNTSHWYTVRATTAVGGGIVNVTGTSNYGCIYGNNTDTRGYFMGKSYRFNFTNTDSVNNYVMAGFDGDSKGIVNTECMAEATNQPMVRIEFFPSTGISLHVNNGTTADSKTLYTGIMSGNFTVVDVIIQNSGNVNATAYASDGITKLGSNVSALTIANMTMSLDVTDWSGNAAIARAQSIIRTDPTPLVNNPAITFQSPTPANNSIQYFTSNSFSISTIVTDLGSPFNVTQAVFYENGSLFSNITNASVNGTNTFSGLPVGRFFYNATATNVTNTTSTETRLLTIYSITSGSINSSNLINSRYKNITWTPSTTTNNSVAISRYLGYIFYPNATLTLVYNGTDKNFTLDSYGNNIIAGSSTSIVIKTLDANSNYATTSQSLNVTTDAQLNVSANDGINGINTFNINVTNNDTLELQNYTTTTGTVYANLVKGNNYTITIDATGYAYKNFSYTPNISLNSTNQTLLITNSIFLHIYDELTGILITDTINFTLQSNTTLNNYTTSTGLYNLTNIDPGDYEIRFTSVNYTTRTYEVTIQNRTTQTLNAYLLNNNQSYAIGVYTKNEVYQVLPNTLITIQRQYFGGSYATILQGYTDINGFLAFYVQQGTNYQVILSVDGYNTKQFNQIFYTANSPYTWILTSTAGGVYINTLNGVNYYYSPTNTTLQNGTYTFTIATFNASFTIAWTALTLPNGSTYNISGSPGGGTASTTVDLGDYSGSYPVKYMFNYLDPNTESYQTYLIPINYYIVNTQPYNNTIISSLATFKNDIGNTGWQTILAVFIILAGVATIVQISGSIMAGIATGFGLMIFFAFIGWISGILVVFIVLISGLLLYMER